MTCFSVLNPLSKRNQASLSWLPLHAKNYGENLTELVPTPFGFLFLFFPPAFSVNMNLLFSCFWLVGTKYEGPYNILGR